ncbi:MAG: hypothetical protein ACHQF4_04215 [Sphingobacteriales bacterium]
METIIKVNPSELNESLLNQIKKYIGGKNNIDVTISLKEFDREYVNTLDRSIEEAEIAEGLVTFTIKDFMSYTPAH